MNKRKRIITVVGLLVVFVIGYFSYQLLTYVKTDNAQIQANTVMLAPKVSGYILKADIREGQKVKADDVLVEIDDRDYQNSLKQLTGDFEAVKAQLHDAENNYSRISKLFKSEAVSQQQYDQAFANVSVVRAKHEAISAQLNQANLNISNTKIRAPVDGFIARKSVEVGQLASPGVPLIGFVSSTERWVNANFKETDLDSIRIGAEVDVEVDAIGGKSFRGVVESLSAATGATFALLPPDNATGNFTKVVQRVPVRIKLTNLAPEDIERLRAGLSAVVKVHKH
jgi:membrane fusion protein (multidrug efflux system)